MNPLSTSAMGNKLLNHVLKPVFLLLNLVVGTEISGNTLSDTFELSKEVLALSD